MKLAILAFSASILMNGCSSFQQSAEERGVAFPLSDCTPEHLERASSLLQDGNSLEFSSEWVCVTKQAAEHLESEKQRGEREALDSKEEQALRLRVETPFLNIKSLGAAFGIALAGGGSKASAFGTGVLAGLADLNMLDNADYISSVSGGSYAAYFYYSHTILPSIRHGEPRPETNALYRDCIRMPTAADDSGGLREAIRAFGGCEPFHLLPVPRKDGSMMDNRHQAFLRCQQDMLRPGICSTSTTTSDLGLSGLAILGTVTLFPVSNIATSLFDWGYGVSPSQRTYRNGIGVAFGSTVTNPTLLSGANNGRQIDVQCDTQGRAVARDCDSRGLFVTPNNHELTFQELRAGLLKGRKAGEKPLPFWIINAAAPKYRSIFGWWTLGSEDTSNSDMFEMTAVSHGSGRFGYVPAPMSLHRMNVLDAVAASAAFLDANQLVYQQPWRGALGLGLHLMNLDWGADIANYSTSDNRRYVHKALPLPFYWTDSLVARLATGDLSEYDRTRSTFIRLIDGGNAENLGVYSLIKRGVKNIVIADAANDVDGQFQDICALAKRFQNAPKGLARSLYVPGLRGFVAHCKAALEGGDSYYDLHAWSFKDPVLVACLRVETQQDSPDQCSQLGPNDTRLLIIKPALDVLRFVERQTRSRRGQNAQLTDCKIPDSTMQDESTLLNCDTSVFLIMNWNGKPGNRCQLFPQHSTVRMTIDSSATLFGAYRELARQYVHQIAPVMHDFVKQSSFATMEHYDDIAYRQWQTEFSPLKWKCGGEPREG